MNDPIIAELRKIRDAHAAEFNFDFDAVVRDWMKKETAARRTGQKFVDLSAKRKGLVGGGVPVGKSNPSQSKP